MHYHYPANMKCKIYARKSKIMQEICQFVILAPKLAKIFCSLIATGSFSALWRTANITQLPKGTSPPQFPLDYRSILITPTITEVFEKLIFPRLFKFVDSIFLKQGFNQNSIMVFYVGNET